MNKTQIIISLILVTILMVPTAMATYNHDPCRICKINNYCIENCMDGDAKDAIVNLINYVPTNTGTGGGCSKQSMGSIIANDGNFFYTHENYAAELEIEIQDLHAQIDEMKQDYKNLTVWLTFNVKR